MKIDWVVESKQACQKHKLLLEPKCVKFMLLFSDVVMEEIAFRSGLRTPDSEVGKT